MNKKKTLALCLATCATIFTSIPVYANNYTDSNLPEKYIGYNNYVDTKLRHKKDGSYHYIYSTASVPIRVISYSPDRDNCTKHGYAVIPANSKRFITNYVNERTYSQCRLSICTGVSGVTTTLHGKWSPDSIGSYPIANP